MAYHLQPRKNSPIQPAVQPGEERQLTPKRKTAKSRVLMLGLGLALLLFSGWAGKVWWEQEEALQRMDEELASLKEQVKRAQERQEELNREIELLGDPEYIAEIARRDYFLSKEGEIIFKAVD